MGFTIFFAVALTAAIAVAEPSQGSIEGWGANSWGQIDVPAPNNGFVAVAAGGYHSLGLKADGSIVAWGNNGYGQTDVPLPNNGFVAVAAGQYDSLGLKSDGSIVTWGDNYFGQLDVPAPNTGFVAIASGGSQTLYGNYNLGLRADGSIVVWGQGCNYQPQTDWHCNVPEPNIGFTAIAGGGFHGLGLKTDGSIVTWGCEGDTYLPPCHVPAPNNGFTFVAAGPTNSLGIQGGGRVVAWGYNFSGENDIPAPNGNYVAVATNGSHTFWGGWFSYSLGLKTDGSIVMWGCESDALLDFGQCDGPSTPNSDFISIAAGPTHVLAIRRRNGACCDLLSGTCAGDVPGSACSGKHQAWTEGAPCADADCEAATGACCDHDPFGGCTDGVIRADCDCPTCEWFKLSSCSELECADGSIPTVSEWGLLVLALALLIGAKLAFQTKSELS